ncbi:MAG: hypothetical protein PHC62_06890 [Candidatus Izemoplasmatales bacterium]|nr:hypothetical protein [Candidatus Izemoplasmatales bacterium]
MLSFKQKLNILKNLGSAKEMKGRGIYSFGLGTSNKKMLLMGRTWEEAISFCEERGWYIKFEKEQD